MDAEESQEDDDRIDYKVLDLPVIKYERKEIEEFIEKQRLERLQLEEKWIDNDGYKLPQQRKILLFNNFYIKKYQTNYDSLVKNFR